MPYSSSTSYYHPPPTPTPAPTTALAVLVAPLLLLLSLYYLGWTPRSSLTGLHEMASFKLSSLAESVGLQGLGKVDWQAVERNEGHKDKGKQSSGAAKSKVTGSGLELYPGLLNVSGNLCYLNATLQSMASLPTLLSYLHQLSLLSTPLFPTPVTTTLLAVLAALNTPSSRPSPLKPVALATALANSSETRKRLMSSREQQDAHELWGMIREAVEEEEGRVLSALAAEEEKERGRGLGEVLHFSGGEEGKERERAVVDDGGAELRDPYLLLTSQRVRCMTCNYTRDVRHTSDQQVVLNVPHSTQISLPTLLAEHTKMDLLSDYACRKCGVLATRDKLLGQSDRLALSSSFPAPTSSTHASSPSSVSPAPPSSSSSNPFSPPPPPPPPPSKMTPSRKDRLRKTQKLVDRLQSVVDASDWEKELGKEFEGAAKVERVQGPAGKVVRFARLPSILPIHLVRSNYYTTSGAYKNTCQVTFPEFLDLGAFSDHPTSSSAGDGEEQGREQQAGGEPIGRGRDLYRLSSLVVHYGSHHFGHYVAFRRRPTTTTTTSSSAPSPSTSPRPALQQQQQPEWYRISDETVSPSTISEVLRANPVLMFYERWEGDDGLGEGGRSRRGARGVRPRVVRRWEVGGGKASEGESGGEKAKDGRREKKEAGEGGSL